MKKVRLVIIILALGLFCLPPGALGDWSAAKRLTWTLGNSYSPALTTDSAGNIHVVWSDDTPGNPEVYYKKSTDAGATWGTAKRLTWNSGASGGQVIAADSSNAIHVVWLDNTPGNFEVYYKRSTDAGLTWSAAQRLTWTPALDQYSAIAIDSSDTVHVAWEDDTATNEYEIFYKKSTDGGASWSPNKRLTWTISSGSYEPAMAPDSGNGVYIAWEDAYAGNWEIYCRDSTDGGTTWSATKRVTLTSGSSYSPAIALDSSDAVHIAWYDDTPGNYEVHFARSTDAGATWSATQRLTWNSGISAEPQTAVDSSNVIHVVWYDDTSGDNEVYHKRSTDGGATWSSATRLTWNSGTSQYQTIAIDAGGAVHVVWQDSTPFNWEIYYKKGT